MSAITEPETGLNRKRHSDRRLFTDPYWWLFCALILSLKLCLLAFDPLPKIFLGDSYSYLWTAVTGWIPNDRSYFYGYLIRYSSFVTESLTPLLILQMFAGTITALVVAWVGHSVFELSARVSYTFGFLCALDPLQLIWERYILTEALSLCLYAFFLERSLVYLKHRRARDVVIVQLIAVCLIGFRMSYLLVVQITAMLLPLIAFLPEFWASVDKRIAGLPSRLALGRKAAGHCLLSVGVMLGLHAGYKHANGFLSHREPGYLYTTGIYLLATWAPALEPADATDPKLAELISKGAEFSIKDMSLRNHQRYFPGYLVKRWQELEPDPVRANQIAKETALRALSRNPMEIMRIAGKTFLGYWDIPSIRSYANYDLGHVNPSGEVLALLAQKFQWAAPKNITETSSLLKRYFLAAWPYYLVVVLSPLWAAILIGLASEKKYAVLLFFHSSIMLTTTLLFAVAPSVRYLHPLSLVSLVTAAGCVRAAMDYRRRASVTAP